MTTKPHRADRRTEALSSQRIVEAAVELLDADGEDALTFRALSARLATGSGAIYWHVADKDELLAAAADHVLAQTVAAIGRDNGPRGEIRAIALAVFDAIDAHPWAGAHLNREPWRPGAVRFFEGIGRSLLALGVPEHARFDAWSTLVNYILGVAWQNAARARRRSGSRERSDVLDTVAQRWEKLDPVEHPFLQGLAGKLRKHDDREQFLAGVDFILTGIAGPE